MMILPLITLIVLISLFIADSAPPPPKSPEEEFGEAIAKYLANGLKASLEDKK
ncbi:MAG TPA: hypothetical protein IGS53_09515 [Leptolyngbyaceae cyanobacterium M33_DOE_097]|nr:hypothetical protein [Leptolyngbyaceae cyanobacterium M33_DOE_097]